MARVRYTDLSASGELARRAVALQARLCACDLCPHVCGADRIAGELGRCRAGTRTHVASYGPHFGEEAPLVGCGLDAGGSGTIFFSHCTLRCVYCQNWDISQRAGGEEFSDDDLAHAMLDLERRGCENVNLVTPTHYLAPIVRALDIAAHAGLHVPLVYNTSGWERIETLRLLDGVVDIYLPDVKYADAQTAHRLSAAFDYPRVAFEALAEMHRQVGELVLDERGAATRGLLVRHLVLPNGLAGTPEVMRFIAQELSPGTWVNVMEQYRPEFQAAEHAEIARRPTAEELAEAREAARAAGLTHVEGWQRREGGGP